MDESGEIRGTGFNTVVDELYDKFEEGKVYYISKARVNLAKKKFSNLQNDYELSLEKSTEVEEVRTTTLPPKCWTHIFYQCLETTSVPMMKYNFVELSSLEKLEKDNTCGRCCAIYVVLFLTCSTRCHWGRQRSWSPQRNYIKGDE